MGTVLTYRNNGERPFCEVALDNGDRVQLQLDKAGVLIERQALEGRPTEILFKGDPDLVTSMCVALLGKTPASNTTPLDLLISIVTQIPSANEVREAFRAAAKAF